MAALGRSQADACRAANHYEGGHHCSDDDNHDGQPCSAAVQALAGLVVEDGIRPQPAPQL